MTLVLAPWSWWNGYHEPFPKLACGVSVQHSAGNFRKIKLKKEAAGTDVNIHAM